MIVRLTNQQVKKVQSVLAPTDLGELVRIRGWWGNDVNQASKHRVDIAMPAVAWRAIERVLFDATFTTRGARSAEATSTMSNALKSTRRALNAREQHPAMSEIGAIGLVSEVIPAWRLPGPDASGKFYVPYPVPGMPFTILAPVTTRVAGKVATQWAEAPTLARTVGLLCEAEHTLFSPYA